MSDSTPDSSATMTIKMATQKFKKLEMKVDATVVTDDHFKRYLNVARSVLGQFPMSGQGGGPAVLPDPEEVGRLMAALLPPAGEVYTDDYFRAPLYPIILLEEIAKFYGCSSVDEQFRDELSLSPLELGNRSIGTQILFAYLQDVDTATARTIIDKYKQRRGSSNVLSRNRAVAAYTGGAQPDEPTPDLSAGQQSSPPIDKPYAPPSVRVESIPTSTRYQSRSDSHRPQDGYVDTRKASYVSQYFKDRQFSGDLSQSIEHSLRDYEICARQHMLSIDQKADYFVNVLDGAARTFFIENCRRGSFFEDIVAFMTAEYNGNSRQLQVHSTLESLRLPRFMQEKEVTSVSSGLTQMVELISRLSPQCPPAYRGDSHKIRFLRSAVLQFSWARVPVSNIVSSKLTFNAFVTALHESLQLEEEIKAHQYPSAIRMAKEELDEKDSVFFQRYGRDPRAVSRRFNSRNGPRSYKGGNKTDRVSKEAFEEARRRKECFRCGKGWTPGHRCEQGAITRHTRTRFMNRENPIHIVRDMVLGMEGEAADDPGTSAVADNDVHFAEDNLCAAFDDAMGLGASADNNDDLIEQLDKKIATNLISSALHPDAGFH